MQSPRAVELPLDPHAVAAAWPADAPLAAIWSGGDAPAARWTLLASPAGPLDDAAARAALAQALPHRATAGPDAPPFTGGMFGALSYDLGRELEPHATAPGAIDDRGWPAMRWLDCPDALAFDSLARRWWLVGEPGPTHALASALRESAPGVAPFRAGALRSNTGPERYAEMVRRALTYIRDGDVYQVNLAHRLTAEFEGSARAFFLALARRAGPWFGGYLEWDDADARRCLASASPEEFLTRSPDGTIRTRPMKGTRPDGPGMDAALRESEKDRAELTMIVDLMRNDLGRVCDLGSVRVGEVRRLERHGPAGGGVLQATAEVSGTLRAGASVRDMLAAAFPGGSVTGAPKVRAMQIIDELEPVRRGPYCGSIGFVSRTGHAAFNIAIRTAAIRGEPLPGGPDRVRGTLDYSVGAGIVADSDPAAEWQETLDKARALAGIIPSRPQ